MTQTLFDVIQNERKVLAKYKPENLCIPEFVTENLKYSLFDWQKKALENFLIFDRGPGFDDFPELKNKPTHLLFNMATGSGKTMVMAALILYYYQKGYNHFLFFVNQNNIVDKTENNFIDNSHNKYLFKSKILLNNTVIPVKKVETFSSNPQGIEIKFTSIQKLYNDIHTERENQTTLADLHQLKIVMLGDEAHHLNARTKNKKQERFDFNAELRSNASNNEVERKGWEHMVLDLLLNKNGKPSENVLLEFTATLPENTEVVEKYADKIIAKFTLKSFLQAGYTKEINLVSSKLAKKERVLHALLFAWYRHQVAIKYGIPNFKPVMLFRSKTIDESREDYEEFLQWTKNASSENFSFLTVLSNNLSDGDNANQQGKTRTEQALQFMHENNFTLEHLANWVKINYQPLNVIITNSQDNETKTEKTDIKIEKLLNNLEAADNPVRAIFTVDRLTEGWDVLNLFDIVRLYEGQNTGGSTKKAGKIPAATVAEKQLIGRGVRYFPFAFEDKQLNKRKFDGVEHELKILEELFYYTFDEQSRYISELKAELRKDGYLPENDNKIKITFAIKPELAQSESFRNLLIWANKKIPNPNAKLNNAESLKQLDVTLSYDTRYSYSLQETLFKVDEKTENTRQLGEEESRSKILKVSDIESHIFDKAIHIKGKHSDSLFHFHRLHNKLGIHSRRELQGNLLCNWRIEFLGLDSERQISAEYKLGACLQVLDKIEQHLNEKDRPFIGTKEFTAKKLWDVFGEPKQKWVNEETVKNEVAKPDWYVLDNFAGTSLEIELVDFIAKRIGDLSDNYDFHLLRNEEVLRLSNFADGEGFMPDFILLLKSKAKTTVSGIQDFLHYQIFIEPKGEHLTKKDQWKEDFLQAITMEYGKDHILREDTPHYRLIGLPFYTVNEDNFATAFQNAI